MKIIWTIYSFSNIKHVNIQKRILTEQIGNSI